MAVIGPGANIAVAVGDILQSRFVVQFSEQTGFNIRHWRVSSITGGSVTLGEVAVSLDATFNPPYAALVVDNAQWRGVGVRRIFPLPVSAEGAQANVVPGGVVSEAIPRQVCGLISLFTAVAGRRGRGRLYVCFPGETDNQDASTPTANYILRLDAVALQLRSQQSVIGANGTATLVPIIWHRSTSTFDVVSSSTSRAVWATQRKRGSYGRANAPPF